MKRRLLLLVLFALSTPLMAQTGAIVSYQLDVFDIAVDPGATGKPLWSGTLPASAVTCNVMPFPTAVTLTQYNPQTVFWSDPNPINVGKICKASTVLLGTLPPSLSTYLLTVSVTDDRGLVSPRS